MKLTKGTIGIIFVMLFLVGAVLLYVSYSGATSAHKTAQANLAAAQKSEPVLNKAKTDLATQLTQAAADVASWNDKIALLQTTMAKANQTFVAAQKQFPPTAESIEYNETLMGIAKSCNLTVSSVVATEAANAEMSTSQFAFNTNVFTINVQGKISDILAFIDKITTTDAFKTGVIVPVGFNIPVPLTQTAKDQMRTDIQAQMFDEINASIKGYDKVLLVEKAILSMLGDNANQPSAEQMTQFIKQTIANQFSPYLGDLLASAITQAIDQNLADTLIDTVASAYAKAIADLFADKNSSIMPTYTGPLADEINAAIQNIPADTIPGVVTKIVHDTLQSLYNEYESEMVPASNIDAALNAAITAAEMPSANLTVAVYSYKGA
jgi:hypothetical protein